MARKVLCAACTVTIPVAWARFCSACGRDHFRLDRTCDLCGRPVNHWCYCGRCALSIWLRIRAAVGPRGENNGREEAAILHNLRNQSAWEGFMRGGHADEMPPSA